MHVAVLFVSCFYYIIIILSKKKSSRVIGPTDSTIFLFLKHLISERHTVKAAENPDPIWLVVLFLL